MTTEQTTDSVFKNVAAGLDHFDPFQGFVDDEKELNLRYGFRLGEINFLINEFTMCEVVKKPIIYPIPNTPSWIQGLINLRGILVPVLNIKKHIEQDNDDKKSDTLLVIDRGERAVATFIDDLPNSINIDDEDFIKTTVPDNTSEILKKYTTGVFSLKQEIWLDIDYDTFIKHMTKDYSDYQADE